MRYPHAHCFKYSRGVREQLEGDGKQAGALEDVEKDQHILREKKLMRPAINSPGVLRLEKISSVRQERSTAGPLSADFRCGNRGVKKASGAVVVARTSSRDGPLTL